MLLFWVHDPLMFRVFCFPLCGRTRSPQRVIPTLPSVSLPFSTSLSRPSGPAAVKALRFQGCSWHLNGPGLITEVALPGHSHLKEQQSTSCQKILCLCKASSRTNHVVVRWGGGPSPHSRVPRPSPALYFILGLYRLWGTTGCCVCRRGEEPQLHTCSML